MSPRKKKSEQINEFEVKLIEKIEALQPNMWESFWFIIHNFACRRMHKSAMKKISRAAAEAIKEVGQ